VGLLDGAFVQVGSQDRGILESCDSCLEEGRFEGAGEAVGDSIGGKVVGTLVGFADGEKDHEGCSDKEGVMLGTSVSNE